MSVVHSHDFFCDKKGLNNSKMDNSLYLHNVTYECPTEIIQIWFEFIFELYKTSIFILLKQEVENHNIYQLPIVAI